MFIGSIIPGKAFHDVRKVLFDHLIQSQIHVDLYANLPRVSEVELLQRQAAYVAVTALKRAGLSALAAHLPLVKKAYGLAEMPSRLRHTEMLEAIAKPPLFGIEMFKALSRAQIGFNMHGEGAGDFAANVRLFEVTGAGACMLTDRKKNLGDFFEEDKEVVAYDTAEECIEKIHWLLDHPAERMAIAEAGQKRTLRDHSFKNRAASLHELITTELQEKRH